VPAPDALKAIACLCHACKVTMMPGISELSNAFTEKISIQQPEIHP
jgi:hypothetical protein